MSLTHKITKNNNKLAITVSLEQQQSGLVGRPDVPWRKFATANARATLVDAGFNPGEALVEGPTINNAASEATATWEFADLNAPADPPPPKAKTTRAKASKAKTTKSGA